MGNTISDNLQNGDDTPVEKLINQFADYLIKLNLGPVVELSIKGFHKLCSKFAQNVVMHGRASFDEIIEKSFLNAFFTGIKMGCFTKGCFLETCSYVCAGILRFAKFAGHEKVVKRALQGIADKIATKASTNFVKYFFQNVVENAASNQHRLLRPNLLKTIGGTVAEEFVENAGKFSQAKAGAKIAFKTGLITDGAILAFTLGYASWQYSKGNIDGAQLKRTAITSTSAAAGSVGMSSAGVFIGTLIFPGVGSFVGGFIGGIAGHYVGHTVGKIFDDTIA